MLALMFSANDSFNLTGKMGTDLVENVPENKEHVTRLT